MVALIATAVLIVRGRLSLRAGLAALAFLAVAWLGLLISFSQSSFAALLVAVLALTAIVWRWKSLFALAAVLVVAAGIAVTPAETDACATPPHGLGPQQRHERAGDPHRGRDPDRRGAPVARRRSRRLRARVLETRRTSTPKKSASHNTPVTVAAEEGGPGLLIFFWLVGALLLATYRRIRHGTYGLVALAAGLALLAIFVHSLAYNDFFEDPTTWVLIGLVGLVSPLRVRARAPARVEPTEPVPEMIAR